MLSALNRNILPAFIFLIFSFQLSFSTNHELYSIPIEQLDLSELMDEQGKPLTINYGSKAESDSLSNSGIYSEKNTNLSPTFDAKPPQSKEEILNAVKAFLTEFSSIYEAINNLERRIYSQPWYRPRPAFFSSRISPFNQRKTIKN